MGAFHSTKTPVRSFGNSACPMERYIPDAQTQPKLPRVYLLTSWKQNIVKWKGTFWSHRTEMTGSVKIDHLQRWSQIFRSDRTETVLSIWFLTTISEVFYWMESAQGSEDNIQFAWAVSFLLFLYLFFHKIQNDTTQTCPCWHIAGNDIVDITEKTEDKKQ